jgi:uncharacterized membrane protein YfcA
VIVRDALAVIGGFVVGVASGVVGIGGGTLLVPMMVIGFGFPQHLAQGTSLAAVIPTAAVGAATHHRLGNVVWRAALVLGVAGVVGAIAGALVALSLPRDLLGRVFGAFLLFSAWRIWPRKSAKTIDS